MATISFFTDMIQQITERGRTLIVRSRDELRTPPDLAQGAEDVLSSKGEASGVARSKSLLEAYAGAGAEKRQIFLQTLAGVFGPDTKWMEEAIENYRREPGPATALALHKAAEPRRQELFRRLNRVQGGTLALVRMREDLLEISKQPGMAEVDNDFWHLFNSWFNRGFLVLSRLDWTAPAHVLEKIIRYEAVHRIGNFEDLRLRLAPQDRRLYAFFHPALVDEPLIFVEVALMREIPGSIDAVLSPERQELPAGNATTAVFYSISNCQKGLAGVSFGNFLIKQVVEELRRDLPILSTFVTLSPIPGFLAWLAAEQADEQSRYLTARYRERLADLGPFDGRQLQPDSHDLFSELVALYLLKAKDKQGRPLDPVARFHLGNGARLERIHPHADNSRKGLLQSAGFMVSYLYDLDAIERSHELFVETGQIVTSNEVRHLAQRTGVSHLAVAL
ncbi:malonyl-CoA decarboxylase [Mesorhizobium sp. YM1C-6-2]|uniref:malonyl-CoA decarboxylase n=1 Tax=Mesorhizobium sp. YM1C-6-2 TaxID=1827501 RepID=UPI000EF22BE5|nr:malonyl-CoA decarboxylase [Mesorhizobium sp. YM1C-6-2]RLP28415.1 MCD, Malonyl-CoA decarboxylase MCD [Mesorhizobium sp. YM1C-6-2]